MNKDNLRNNEAKELIQIGKIREAMSKLQSSLIELLTEEIHSGIEESSRKKWNEFRDLVSMIGFLSLSNSIYITQDY